MIKNKFLIIVIFITGVSCAFTQDADLINRAVSEGDCGTLYLFTSSPEGKDQRLVTSAAQALRRYTVYDTAAARYRTNRMDSRIRNIGNALTENVFTDPQRYLPDVVTRLITGVSDHLQRAKIINDWICDNIAYDAQTYFGTAYRSQDYVSVLNSKLAVCAGFASLFNEMCRLASVECIIISGFSKGFGYTGRIGSYPDHDWNAVKVNNKWYLVDVTWNAGHMDNRTYIKRYSTDYLFLDSRSFLYSHLPLDNKYQFYAPLVTREQFVEEPYIAGAFFKYQLTFNSERLRYNNFAGNGGYVLELTSSNSALQLISAVRTAQQQDIAGAEWQEKSGNTTTFIFDVPDGGDYKGHVFARLSSDRRINSRIPINTYEQRIIPLLDELLQNRRITESEKEYFINSYYKIPQNGYYYFSEDQFDTARNNAVIKIHPLVNLSLEQFESILNFNLKAAGGYNGFSGSYSRRFPDSYTAFREASSTRLISPVKGILKSGDTETFAVTSRDYTGFTVQINGRYVNFTRNGNGPFELELTIPSGINQLIIYGIRSNSYTGLIRYAVEQ